MIKNKKLGFVIWLISFALSVFLALIIPSHYSSNIIVTLIFNMIAYISVLILWINLFKHGKSPSDVFYCSPAMAISIAYPVIQTILCIVVGFLTDIISFKLTMILNVVFMAVVWIATLSIILSINHAQNIDSRQNEHHTKL